MNFSTKNIQVILASSSKARIDYLKKNKISFLAKKHNVDEEKIKKETKIPTHLSERLSLLKARSIKTTNKKQFIIGSDQILVCQNKIINKPRTVSEAKKNLQFLRRKEHTLISSVIAVQNGDVVFKETCKAKLKFKDISDKQLEEYLNENKETALSCVGSYKIEDNSKYKFIEIIQGTLETIIGFPAKNLINIIKNEKNICNRKSS
tara:strand:- start:190 stop:807 length:618 start_codon:yes stop_codon:yes gene_type:complete